jgi:hypothetical protein
VFLARFLSGPKCLVQPVVEIDDVPHFPVREYGSHAGLEAGRDVDTVDGSSPDDPVLLFREERPSRLTALAAFLFANEVHSGPITVD